MNREQFLARVREAAAAGRAYRVHSRPVPAGTGYEGGGPDLPARFASEVAAVGGFAYLVEDRDAARQQVANLLERFSARTALTWQHDVLDRLGLDELLAQRQIERLNYESLAPLPPAEQRKRILAADLGITSTTVAIAETGSMAVASGPGTERVASLLPPILLSIVERDQLLPDLFDLFAWYEGESLPTNLTLITGPSKTGDIELTLTTGVHGPGEWHVVVIRQSA